MSAKHTPSSSGQPAEPRTRTSRDERTTTILLVEDEDAVREFVRVVLDHAGHVVVTAADGNQGLTQFLAEPDRFDLVLTDVVMPNRTGPEMAEMLRDVRPELQLVFMSAYVGGPTHPIELPHGATLLEKPFSLDQLLHTVFHALENLLGQLIFSARNEERGMRNER